MATRTIANGGGNYNSAGTWVEGFVPTSSDDVVATATSGQLTVNVASVAKTFIMTGYTNTLTLNNTLTVAGAVTFVAGMTIAGTSNLICTTTATLTSGGKTLTGGLQLKGTSQTYTFGDAWTINGAWTFAGTTAVTLAGAFNVTAGTIAISNTTSTAGQIITLVSGQTYTVTTAFNCFALTSTIHTLKASTPSSPAYLNLQNGATMDVGYLNVTDINSSGGITIWDFQGGSTALLRTVNWNLFTQPFTIGSAFLQ